MSWEQTRMLATITIQPHLGKRKKITPEKLLPFPWDKKKQPQKGRTLTKEEHRARMEELAKRLGETLI